MSQHNLVKISTRLEDIRLICAWCNSMVRYPLISTPGEGQVAIHQDPNSGRSERCPADLLWNKLYKDGEDVTRLIATLLGRAAL